MDWNALTTQAELEDLIERSKSVSCLIFKHSISCPISSMAKNRMEMNWSIPANDVAVYYLDLITYRPISNLIADTFQVEHQSPQVLLIEEGKCTFNTSHLDITVDSIKSNLPLK